MEEPDLDPRQKGSCWLSLLSVLMAARVESMAVVLVERALDGVWEFAFWNHDPDGIACTYRCGTGDMIWKPIETPVYSGRVRPWTDPHDPRRNDPRKKKH